MIHNRIKVGNVLHELIHISVFIVLILNGSGKIKQMIFRYGVGITAAQGFLNILFKNKRFAIINDDAIHSQAQQMLGAIIDTYFLA
ncbi:hypothetical protein D3C81_1317880 [compost metagenome]